MVFIFSALLFQETAVKHILSLRFLSRNINAVVGFILTISFILFVLNIKKVITESSKEVIFFYIIPVFLVLIGYFLNFILSFYVAGGELRSLHIEQTARFLPWLATISLVNIDALRNNIEKWWRAYYYFMLIAAICSLIEYFLVHNHILPLCRLEMKCGNLLAKGVINWHLFHLDGTVNERMYGIWQEPGTAGMYLSVALIYAVIFARKMSIVVFLTAIYFTWSHGAFMGLFVTTVFFAFYKLKDGTFNFNKVQKYVVFCMIVLVVFFIARKENSMFLRKYRHVDDLWGTVTNFYYVMLEYPWGYLLKVSAFVDLDVIEKEKIHASVLSIYYAFLQGGMLAFVGYLLFVVGIIIATIKYFLIMLYSKSNNYGNKIYVCAFILLPVQLLYIVQRTPIIDTMLFAFLFAIPVIKMLNTKVGLKLKK